MFEILYNLPTNQVITSVHHTLNLLTHRNRISETKGKYKIEGVLADLPNETEQIALRLLSEIEEAEKGSVRQLSEEKAEQYIRSLGRIVEKVTAQAYEYNHKRGEELLEKFRSDKDKQVSSSNRQSSFRADSRLKRIILTSIKFVTVTIERFGWPGITLVTILLSIMLWATPEQKREIIDVYILGKGTQTVWYVLGFIVLLILVSFAQYTLSKRRIEREMKRIAEEKASFQEHLLKSLYSWSIKNEK